MLRDKNERKKKQIKKGIKKWELNLKKKWNKMLRDKIERKQIRKEYKKTTIKRMGTIFNIKNKTKSNGKGVK